MGNLKIERRLETIQRSRNLLALVNDAISALRTKPGDGATMYDVLYFTFLSLQKLTLVQILDELNFSQRHYYRLRKQAVNLLSILLWASPIVEVDCWMELCDMLNLMYLFVKMVKKLSEDYGK
jgi:hypothetical protein